MGLLDWLTGRKGSVASGDVLRVPDGVFRFIALDVETANDWSGSICQIGLACVGYDDRITTVSGLIDPEGPFADFNTRLHGINRAKVRGCPTFRNAFPGLVHALSRQPVVQHSTFDQNAINAACERCGLPRPDIDWINSVTIARRTWPALSDTGGHGLGNLKQVLGLSFSHHDAGEDARAAAQVVLLAEKASGKTFQDILATRSTPQKAIRATGNADGPLFGMIAVFTGALKISREEAATRAATFGLTVTTSVSRKTSLLIVGDQDLTLLAGHTKSTKHRRAEELIAEGSDIRIIGESEFLAMLANAER